MINIKLGDKVKDTITGFTGIATARINYIYKCVQIQITGKKGKEDSAPSEWFDEAGIVVVKKNAIKKKKEAKVKSTGGPKRNTPTIHYPK